MYNRTAYALLTERSEDIIERFEKFSLSIAELYHFLHKITRAEMEEYGLNGPHAIYFFILYRFPNGLTCSEISELSFRNKSDVSRAIATFEKKGLVFKKGGAQNSYRAKIALTALGIAAAERLRERAKVVVDVVSNGVSDENREILYDSLGKIADNMRNVCDSD